MPKEQYEKAAKSSEEAAKNFKKASDHYGKDEHEKGAHYAQTGRAHKEDAMDAAKQGGKEHAKKYGTK